MTQETTAASARKPYGAPSLRKSQALRDVTAIAKEISGKKKLDKVT